MNRILYSSSLHSGSTALPMYSAATSTATVSATSTATAIRYSYSYSLLATRYTLHALVQERDNIFHLHITPYRGCLRKKQIAKSIGKRLQSIIQLYFNVKPKENYPSGSSDYLSRGKQNTFVNPQHVIFNYTIKSWKNWVINYKMCWIGLTVLLSHAAMGHAL